MIARRRKLIVKLTVYMIYVIGVLVIAKRVLRVSDSFAFDNRISQTDKILGEKNDGSRKIDADIEKTLDENEEEKKYEKTISEWEGRIIPLLGDGGQPASLDTEEKAGADKIFAKRAANIVLSDKIPLTRRLQDPRDPLCQDMIYERSLPTASVVIIFYNEPWSLLLRTVRSVLDGSPERLLEEIILVDDHSDEEELGGLLDYYARTRFPDKVRLIRLDRRLGLIRARLAGAEKAKGDVLVFLDAHCEVAIQWLEPLLQRIKDKRNAVVTPIIDDISEKTFEYLPESDPSMFTVGGFSWTGDFTWINIQEKDLRSRRTRISPVSSPTMAGGLFAIDRLYFWEIGSYDKKMDGWGGENLEMSFRIWQCGGSLEIVPCSRVGHIFRDFHPYKFPDNKDTHGINTARLVYVWMDEYKRLFLFHREEFMRNKSAIGDLTERMELRKKLRCKTFQWYLDNVYPEKFIPDEGVKAYGRIKLKNRNMCLDSLQRNEDQPYFIGLYSCHDKALPSQFFSLSNRSELRREETCAVVDTKEEASLHPKVSMVKCNYGQDNPEWILTKAGKIIYVATGLCLDATGIKAEGEVFVNKCSETIPDQYWQFDFHGNNVPRIGATPRRVFQTHSI